MAHTLPRLAAAGATGSPATERGHFLQSPDIRPGRLEAEALPGTPRKPGGGGRDETFPCRAPEAHSHCGV